MKIGIIGAGAEGSGLGGLLVLEEDVEELRLADIHEGRLQLSLSRIQGLGKATLTKGSIVDAANSAEVAEWGRGLDTIVNATLPTFNLAVMHGCLEARAHYVDLNSGPFEVEGLIPYEHTIDAQFALNDAFATRGLTAVSCAGVAPGWVDLAARYATERLDEIDTVLVRWVEWNDGSDLVSSVGPGLIANFNMPTPMVWDDGDVSTVDLFDSEEIYEWPAPLHGIAVYTGFMHPEMRTMRNLPCAISHIEVKSGLSMGRWRSSRDIWIEALRRQLTPGAVRQSEPLAECLGRSFVPPEEYERAITEGLVTEAFLAVAVEVQGTARDQTVQHTIGLMVSLTEARRHLPWATHMVYATSGTTPIALTPRLARGELSQIGVVGVGALEEWHQLFDAITARGHHTWERVVTTGTPRVHDPTPPSSNTTSIPIAQ